jgi:hypothetical protein
MHLRRNCDDGNPCTIDECDPYWGCSHTPVVCGAGKRCVNGVCQTISSPRAAPSSYTIPPGSSIKSALGNGSHSHRLCKGREWSYICCRTAPYILKTARLRSGRSCSPGNKSGSWERRDGGPRLAKQSLQRYSDQA